MKTQHTRIPGYPNYAADEKGNIWSLTVWRGQKERILVPIVNGHDYLKVRVVNNGIRRNMTVHKLMAITFLGPKPSSEHEVRHLNGDRKDNRLINLAWGTRKENASDRDQHGRTSRGVMHGDAIRSGKANAAIIVAAPDLFEACQAAFENLGPLYPESHIVMVKLRAALAKAKGELC